MTSLAVRSDTRILSTLPHRRELEIRDYFVADLRCSRSHTVRAEQWLP